MTFARNLLIDRGPTWLPLMAVSLVACHGYLTFTCQQEDDCGSGFECRPVKGSLGVCCKRGTYPDRGACELGGGDSGRGDAKSGGDSGPQGDDDDPVWARTFSWESLGTPGGLNLALWGRSLKELNVDGTGGLHLHNGSTWQPVAGASYAGDVHRLAGTTSHLYYGAEFGGLSVFDGATASSITLAQSSPQGIFDLRVHGDADLFVVVNASDDALERTDHTTGSMLTTASAHSVGVFRAVWSDATAVYIGCDSATILRAPLDGGAIVFASESLEIPNGWSAADITVWQIRNIGEALWAATTGPLLYQRQASGQWSLQYPKNPVWDSTARYHAFTALAGWGSGSETEIVAVRNASSSFVFFDAGFWTERPLPQGPARNMNAVWSPAPGDYVIAGYRLGEVQGEVFKGHASAE